MDLDEKKRLSSNGNTSKEACTTRFLAARITTGISQKDFAKEMNAQSSNISNTEKGMQFPSRSAMHHLYGAYRIDYNFILRGDFAQLPSDVQDKLFDALVTLDKSQDQTQD